MRELSYGFTLDDDGRISMQSDKSRNASTAASCRRERRLVLKLRVHRPRVSQGWRTI